MPRVGVRCSELLGQCMDLKYARCMNRRRCCSSNLNPGDAFPRARSVTVDSIEDLSAVKALKPIECRAATGLIVRENGLNGAFIPIVRVDNFSLLSNEAAKILFGGVA